MQQTHICRIRNSNGLQQCPTPTTSTHGQCSIAIEAGATASAPRAVGGAAEWARGVLPVPVCQALEVEPLAAAAVVAYHVLALKVTAETDRTAIIVVGGIKPILALG